MRHTVTILALFIALGVTGCATTKDLEAVRLQAQQANQTADAALQTAEDAKAIAQEAKMIAQNANATAQDADATSKTTENKIDRMFKKAMYK